MSSDLQMRVERRNDRIAIFIAGVVDFVNVPAFRRALDAAFAGDVGRVEIHFGKIDLMDSSGLSALIHAHKLAAASGKDLVLRGNGDVVKRLLQRTSLDRLIKITPEDDGDEHLAA
jgi:anti-sigma B factor antagonist